MTLFNSPEQEHSQKNEAQAQTLGSRIAEHRKKHNLTQEEFSLLLGVTAQAVSKWENDVSCPDIMLLPKISEILEVSIDELMGVKSETKKEEINCPEAAEQIDLNKLKLRIHITDSRSKPTNVTLPMGFVMKVANVGVKISGVLGNSVINDLQLNQILELVKNGVTGEILNFDSEDGTNIRIEIS
ncbi:MAG: helix-turn-helix transcriptional regulator [Clostridia bacterium]|nr:helix-turn-helix transcriptional regulator [Clostridia bacterium]